MKMKKVWVSLFILFTVVVLFSPHWVQFPAEKWLPWLALGKDRHELYEALNLMAPFAAVLGAVATFIAFYVQFSANQTLREENRGLQEKNRMDVVTAHFFELLRLHKENVNELTWREVAGGNELEKAVTEESGAQNNSNSLDEIDISSLSNKDDKPVTKYFDSLVQRQGKFLFDYCLTEFNLVYVLYKDFVQNTCESSINLVQTIKIAYNYFYKRCSINGFNIEDQLYKIYRNLKDADSYNGFLQICKGSFVTIDAEIEKVLEKVFRTRQYFIANSENHCPPIDMLNQYYRHLYMTVKYVAANKEIEYEKKRELLRILRAQMSRQEQILLFYNWISGNGIQWEKMSEGDSHSNNHFFTDYRMIHNVNPFDCIFLEFLRNSKVEEKWYSEDDEKDMLESKYFICMFMNNSKNFVDRTWKCEEGNDNDSLFEFEDWDGFPKLGQPKKEEEPLKTFWEKFGFKCQKDA